MNNLELIDKLCGIVEEQAELIKAQQFAIEQSKIKDDFIETRKSIDDELDLVEYSLRQRI